MMMISCMLNVQVDDGSCIVDLASVLRAVACVVYEYFGRNQRVSLAHYVRRYSASLHCCSPYRGREMARPMLLGTLGPYRSILI